MLSPLDPSVGKTLMTQVASRLWVTSSIALCCLATISPARAQIVPDNTLPSNSIVTPGCTVCTIDGGTVRGVNLFHSFSEFGVPTGGEAFFNNALQIENIFSRVTGTSVSNIDGLLRANGTANLFLLNPNGIIFGRGARLEIGGSFAASTANSFKFSDGSEFSATNPQAPPLLTINVTPGLQWGVSQPGATITNRGNLAPRQDLTLFADKLDLQGQLQAGGDLTLLAQDTVKVRDTAANPFIASAGGQLRIQGNERVDIFALNHPDSGLFSGGDMVLRSANTVGGDAHYSAGGSFRIEQLNGSLGNLSSPHDPIILASGDVSLGDYTGASLHILAGGSVTLGSVEISATDSAANTISPSNPNPFLASLASVQLSDGTNITIDGSARPTLDVRAGIDWTTFPGGAPGNTTIGTVAPPPNFAGATRADITVNGRFFWVSEPNGVVLLTNQYRSNRLPGNISTKRIITGGCLGSSCARSGNGGAIAIDSRGNIFTQGDIKSFSFEGNGGAIALMAGGNVTTAKDIDNVYPLELQLGNLNSSTFGGNGGTITVTAGGNITIAGLDSSSNKGDGGAIALTTGGNITIERVNSFSTKEGNGGAIALTADGNITTGFLASNSIDGNGGAVTLATTNGTINLTSNGRSSTFSTNDFSGIDASGASGGNINLTSHVGILKLQDGLISSNASNGNGGNIQITAPSVSLTNTDLSSTATGRGNAGNISILTDGSVSLDNSRLFTSLNPGGIGKGGDIKIEAGSVSLTGTSFIDTATFDQGNAGKVLIKVGESVSLDENSAIFSITAGQGRGGDVRVEAGGNVSLANGSNISTAVNPKAVGDGGNIEIEARSLSLTGGSQLVTNTFSSGKAGEITVNATENVITSGVDPNSTTSPLRNVPVTPPKTLEKAKSNDSIDQAQPLDNFFSLDSPDNINPNVKFSTTIPYVYISSSGNSGGSFVNEDYYSFKVERAGTRGIFDIQKLTGNGRVYSIVLLNSAGKQVASNDGTNPGLGSSNPRLRYVFSEPGTYFIRVDSYLETRYNFQVSLDTPNVTSVVRGALASGMFARSEGAGAAGNVTIKTPQLTVQDGGNISATATDAATRSAQGGSIRVNASQVNLSGNNSGLFALTEGAAPAGSLRLQPYNNEPTLTVNLQQGAQISASTSSSGQGGTLEVTAPSSITLSGNGTLGATAEASSTGRAGNVLLTTQQLTVANGARVSASTNSTNPSATGGNLTVQASQLNLTGGSSLSAGTTGAAQGGNLTIEPLGNGQTLSVNFQGGATASASTSGSGQGGTLTVTAPESITLSGDGSLISAETTGSGAGGNLTLKTGTLTVQDGAQVRAGTSGEGNGGNLTVNASDSVQVLGAGSGLFVNATTGSTAGNLEVTTGQMTVSDGAQVTVSSPSGQAGNLTIQANSVHLNQGTLLAETGKSGFEGGANITLNDLDLLRLDNESLISANAFDQANGGNITIDSTFIVATPPTGSNGSDITANAVEGNGGRVIITTQGLFGIQFRPQRTPKNDITVSSQFGLTGEFQLNSPDVDPNRGLINLPTAPVDTQVSQVCQAGATQNQNSFIITGRGGLPPNPRQVLRSRAVEVDWVSLDASANNPTEDIQNRGTQRRVSRSQNAQTVNNVNNQAQKIVEAQGWVIDDNGKIALVATAPTATPHSSWQKPVECHIEESTK